VDDVTALYDLQRFSDAQESIYAQSLNELKAGQKRTHWMWFIFPQVATVRWRYAINSRDEAQA